VTMMWTSKPSSMRPWW